MKIYRDEQNDLILSVTDSGYGFPVVTFLAEMGMAFGTHEKIVEGAVADFLAGEGSIHLLSNETPLVPIDGDDDHPYVGLTLDEVIKKFGLVAEEL